MAFTQAARYVAECTTPDDYLLVAAELPEIHVFAHRRCRGAGGAGDGPLHLSDDQRRALARLSGQSVPIRSCRRLPFQSEFIGPSRCWRAHQRSLPRGRNDRRSVSGVRGRQSDAAARGSALGTSMLHVRPLHRDPALRSTPGYRGAGRYGDWRFDPMHRGHIEILPRRGRASRRAAAVPTSRRMPTSDEASAAPAEESAGAIVDSIRYISYTHVNQFDTETILKTAGPRYYVKGKDWKAGCRRSSCASAPDHGIGIVYLDTVRDSSAGSSNSSYREANHTMNITEFEQRVLERGRSVPGITTPSISPATADEGNNYNLGRDARSKRRNPSHQGSFPARESARISAADRAR